MGKLKKGRSNGNHAKAPQNATPRPAAPAPPAAVTKALVSAPVATAAPATTTTTDSKPPSFTSLGRSSRPPPGIGARSIRSVSSASLDTTASPSHYASPSSSPPMTSSLTSSGNASPAHSSTTSALSLLRNRLETDEAHRTRIASETGAAEEVPKKLKKRRPSAGPDAFVEPGDTLSEVAEVEAVAGPDPDAGANGDHVEDDDDERSGSIVEYEDESAPAAHEQRCVHYADELTRVIPIAEAQTWTSWGLQTGLTLGKTVARRLPVVGAFVPPEVCQEDDPHPATLHLDEPDAPPPKVHGIAWEVTEIALGLTVASVLLAGVGVELAWGRVFGKKADKGEARA